MKKLSSKKGMAIEMAVIFMLMTFLLCFMLSSIMYGVSLSGNVIQNNQQQRFLFDYVGERYVATKSLDYSTLGFEGYKFAQGDSVNDVVVSQKKGDDWQDRYFIVLTSQSTSNDATQTTTYTLTIYGDSDQTIDLFVLTLQSTVEGEVTKDQITQWIYK